MTTRVVLLPGLDGTGRLFDRFTIACPPGFEPQVLSFPDESPLDYEGLAGRVRPRLPSEDGWILLGESFSGPLALRLAAERPPGLRAVVLCASFVRAPWPAPLIRAVAGRAGRYAPPGWALRWFMTGGDGALADRVREAVSCPSAAVIETRLRSVAAVDATDDLRHVRAEVLVLQAARDRLVRARCVTEMREVRPDLRVVEIPAPHLLLQSASRAAWDAIKSLVEPPETGDSHASDVSA